MATTYRAVAGTDALVSKTEGFDGTVTFRAYEPSVGGYFSSSHFSLTSIGDARYGDVATRKISAAIDAMPAYSDERYAAASEHFAIAKKDAIAMIFATFPEARSGRVSGGEVFADAAA